MDSERSRRRSVNNYVLIFVFLNCLLFISESPRSRRGSGSDRDDNRPWSGKSTMTTKSRLESAQSRYKKRMSYVPPRQRKNSSLRQSKDQKNEENEKEKQALSALSRRSVRNFDDKKFRSSSHLTPVDW